MAANQPPTDHDRNAHQVRYRDPDTGKFKPPCKPAEEKPTDERARNKS